MTKKKVTDGIIANHIVSVELNDDPNQTLLAVKSIAAFRGIEERIQEMKEHLQEAAKNGGTQSKYAADSAEALENALRHLSKIKNQKELKAARDMAYCLLNAFQSMWRVDVKKIEPQVVTGGKIRRGGLNGVEKLQKAREPEHQKLKEAADELRREFPGETKNQIAKRMEKRGLGKQGTIRKII